MRDNKEKRKIDKRSPNFTLSEETTLIGLVTKFKDIIECKKTDTDISRKKKNIWVQVTDEFNAICGGTYRTSDVLLNKYRNLKKRSKKRFAEDKYLTQGTDGDPTKQFITADTDAELKEIFETHITGLNGRFDDDNMVTLIVEDEDVQQELENPDQNNAQNNERDMSSTETSTSTSFPQPASLEIPSPSASMNRSSYTPAKLKAARSKVLNTTGSKNRSKRSKLSDRLRSWMDSKTEMAPLQAQIMLEQHNLFMRQQREKHEMEMRFAKEEHALKMELLKKKLNE